MLPPPPARSPSLKQALSANFLAPMKHFLFAVHAANAQELYTSLVNPDTMLGTSDAKIGSLAPRSHLASPERHSEPRDVLFFQVLK